MQISFHVDSTIKAEGWMEDFPDNRGCISLAINHSTRNPWGDAVHSQGELSLHGSRDSIRAFGQAIIDAANGQCVRIDQFPASTTGKPGTAD